MIPWVKIAITRGRSRIVWVSSITVCASGERNAPAIPWNTRKVTSWERFWASPHSTEASVNDATEPTSSHLIPIRSTSHPASGSTTAEART